MCVNWDIVNKRIIRMLFTLGYKYLAFVTYMHDCVVGDSVHCFVFRLGVANCPVKEEDIRPAEGKVIVGLMREKDLSLMMCDVLKRCDIETIIMLHAVCRNSTYIPAISYKKETYEYGFLRYMNMLTIDDAKIVLFRDTPALLVKIMDEKYIIVPRRVRKLEELILSKTCENLLCQS